MGLDAVREALPGYAKDLKLNLASLPTGSLLSEQQLWGAVVAAAIASPASTATAELTAEGRMHLSPVAYDGAKAAAAVMAMNNVYYRSKHLLAQAGATAYDALPARLRMQVIASSAGVEKADFELWCLVVSAVNGCGACLAAHERGLRGLGVTAEQVHDGLRVAAVVHGACATLAAEAVLDGSAASVVGPPPTGVPGDGAVVPGG
ncbi:MAG: carboxymuconolactone decarboxylase family protein [Acidimicrobiales bacterium]